MLITVGVTTAVWLAVTFLTAPEPDAMLDAFYRKVRPGGRGWRKVAERLGFADDRIPGGALSWVNWVAGVVAVYASLFARGRLAHRQSPERVGLRGGGDCGFLVDSA